MDRGTPNPGLAGGTRHVEQNECCEIPPASQPVDVHGFVGGTAGPQVDAGLDCRIEVDLVTLRLPTAPIEFEADSAPMPAA